MVSDNRFFEVDKICFEYSKNESSKDKESHRTIFRQSEGNHLHLNIFARMRKTNITSQSNTFTITLFDRKYKTRESVEVEICFDNMYDTCHAYCVFKNADLSEGTYTIEAAYPNIESFYCDVSIVDIPEKYTDCFRYDAFIISRINDDQDLAEAYENPVQNSFNIEGLEGIIVASCFTNRLKRNWSYELVTKVYNQLGQVVDCDVVTGTAGHEQSALNDDDDYDSDKPAKEFGVNAMFGRYKRDYWQRGVYTVKIEFMGEDLIVASFDVCDKDVSTLFSKDAIQPKTNIAGKKIIRAEIVQSTAMESLNEMIGLRSIKEQVKSFTAQIEFDRLRGEQGLPIMKSSLHCLFVGNPGTGKTTVAELIGSLFKEIGILSSGHVVCEERSTLIGPLYSDELQLVQKAVDKAKGGVLFIDEAYNLYIDNDPKDPGRRILESLLTSLSDEKNRDWMLVLAGYPAPMRKMLDSNVGLASRVPNTYHFDDYDQKELMQIAKLYLKRNCYQFTSEAETAFDMIVKRECATRDEQFGNGRFVNNLIEKKIIPTMASRVIRTGTPDVSMLTTIEKCDIPAMNELGDYDGIIGKLHKMVGLKTLKDNIETHLNYVKFVNSRRDKDIYTSTPPLHMVFTGNPGTGKTTVADYLGEIYNALGLISNGQVIKANRASLIGAHIGETEKKVSEITKLAKGNILFIDEAYTLFDGSGQKNDFGSRAMEVLLDTLSKDDIDMIVILAGYPQEMDKLLSENIGLKSRFPYTFHFEDYSPDELMQIAEGVAERNNVVFSKDAREAIKAVITKEHRLKDINFGNARFIVRLITTKVIPNMSTRLSKLPPQMLQDEDILRIIEASDVPICAEDVDIINNNSFNEKAISETLNKLDKMAGLTQVKKAIHDFVKVARHINTHKKELAGDLSLKWSFVGNTGTGKSTVAGIMADLLKAMHLLGKGHVIELKAEDIYASNSFKADELVKDAMTKAQQGLLFVDGDAPQFKSPNSNYDKQFLRMCLSSNTSKMSGNCAVIIAEHESARQSITNELIKSGITTLDQTLVFNDYTHDDLMEIITQILSRYNLFFNDQSRDVIYKYIGSLCRNNSTGFANARTMKIIADAIYKMVILRESDTESVNPGEIVLEDVDKFTDLRLMSRKLGY